MAAINFPNSPVVGQIFTAGNGASYTWNGTAWLYSGGGTSGGGSGGASLSVGVSPPVAPQAGALWWDSDAGQLYLSYDDGTSQQWVAATANMIPGNFVAKTGDTMTGGLTAPTVVASWLLVDANYAMTMSGGRPILILDVDDNLLFDRTANSLTFNVGNAPKLTVDSTSKVTANAFAIDGTAWFQSGGANAYLQYDTNDYYTYNRSNDTLAFAIAGVNKYTWAPNGDFTAGGLYATNGVFCSGGSVAILGTTGGGTIFLRPNGQASATGQATYDTNGHFGITGNGWKPGGGSWADSSDARIKTVLEPYATGLASILALNPVRYTFKGNETLEDPSLVREGDDAPAGSPHAGVTDKEYIGLIAQEAEVSMPEMVSQREGWIDGVHVTDLRGLDTTPLIFALVNAVKELTARLEALEGV